MSLFRTVRVVGTSIFIVHFDILRYTYNTNRRDGRLPVNYSQFEDDMLTIRRQLNNHWVEAMHIFLI